MSNQEIEDDPDTEFFATFAQECHSFLSESNQAHLAIEEELKTVEARRSEIEAALNGLIKHKDTLDFTSQPLFSSL